MVPATTGWRDSITREVIPWPKGDGLDGQTVAAIKIVWEIDALRLLGIPDADVHDLGSEYVADLVADKIVDGLHVQFGGQALLHAVDDGELGGALLGLLEQAGRLVEQAHVLDRDGGLIGKRRQAGQSASSVNGRASLRRTTIAPMALPSRSSGVETAVR